MFIWTILNIVMGFAQRIGADVNEVKSLYHDIRDQYNASKQSEAAAAGVPVDSAALLPDTYEEASARLHSQFSQNLADLDAEDQRRAAEDAADSGKGNQ